VVLNFLIKIHDPIKTEIKNRITDGVKTELTDRSKAFLSNLFASSEFKFYISLNKMMEVTSPYLQISEKNLIDNSVTEFEYVEYLNI